MHREARAGRQGWGGVLDATTGRLLDSVSDQGQCGGYVVAWLARGLAGRHDNPYIATSVDIQQR